MFYCDLNLIVPTNVRWSILHVWWNGNVTLANMEFMAYVMMIIIIIIIITSLLESI